MSVYTASLCPCLVQIDKERKFYTEGRIYYDEVNKRVREFEFEDINSEKDYYDKLRLYDLVSIVLLSLPDPSFIHLFIHSFMRSFAHSFVRPFIRSFIHSFIRPSFNSFVHPPTHPPPPIHPSTHPSIHSFIHSFIQFIYLSVQVFTYLHADILSFLFMHL